MNYVGYNIRINLQEQKNRLSTTTEAQFANRLKYFLDFLISDKRLSDILSDITNVYPMSETTYDEYLQKAQRGNRQLSFANEAEQSAFSYQFLLRYTNENNYEIVKCSAFDSHGFVRTKEHILQNYITPIVNYLQDTIDKSNSILYLLEKYKRRTEWFTRTHLHNKYLSEQANFEQIFEDDLRLFLFDQGIEYPFSTPHSPSGRADVVGDLDTDDPIVVEIKLFDRKRKYGKDRVKSGLSQVIKYANDYNQHVGYLVIFNLDSAELDFKFEGTIRVLTPYLEYNGKIFYFIVVNVAFAESASKIGKTEVITMTSDELVNQVTA